MSVQALYVTPRCWKGNLHSVPSGAVPPVVKQRSGSCTWGSPICALRTCSSISILCCVQKNMPFFKASISWYQHVCFYHIETLKSICLCAEFGGATSTSMQYSQMGLAIRNCGACNTDAILLVCVSLPHFYASIHSTYSRHTLRLHTCAHDVAPTAAENFPALHWESSKSKCYYGSTLLFSGSASSLQ